MNAFHDTSIGLRDTCYSFSCKHVSSKETFIFQAAEIVCKSEKYFTFGSAVITKMFLNFETGTFLCETLWELEAGSLNSDLVLD